ncbi:hypothetical protein BFP97_10640 [Roseivirga sp. 4D4]|nr:hypothetical protein BFP97_10640 [Roseivirga sp. 4D4]
MPKAPKGIVRFVLAFVVLLFVIMGGVSYFLSTSHDHITNGTYEFGELTEVKGVIRMEPVPHIRVLADEEGKIGKNIMLIDFGKFGARSSVEKMQEKTGGSISDFEVTIRGTLIYQDGFTLMELTEKENALLDWKEVMAFMPIEEVPPAYYVELTGEIVDPKCYFGSMKPAQNKPHLSCAALCISGGIPPVYVVQTKAKTARYFILKGQDGQDINEEVLDFVAQGVKIQGEFLKHHEWNILYIDPQKIRRLE